ncbi:1-acyl-sn-glycerol-3-phosphate acyltransferase [Pollutimonas nitritireducens]|uniref:1-acyl-sn-glycerol-3-phosphate acyltransferase n=1 Tax=Pollutimonas nitritireducens TaxID=2045209 RepID=A0A2N4UIE3_9BURK|nr:lysophospholipid acyltransferase family protein [Pollutimonas nitritireducens]PLC54781.1 1-acyl-sn-glycerol-3-phosphate acyltransferase [Pollutimonas nitritireducens]
MTVLLFLPRAVLLIIWLLLGLLLVSAVFPYCTPAARSAITRRWSRVLLFFCGVRVEVSGQPIPHGPALWVANHVSWIDIFVINSVRPTSFIAKSEIRHWPVIGWLVSGSGTVFIERGHRHAVREVGQQMKARFERGEIVGLFPEGTTSPGYDVAPFHSSLFDPAIRVNVDIQPLALRFFHRGQRSDYVAFVGEQTLLRNMWRLLGTTGVSIELEFLAVMSGDYCAQHGRNKVSAHAHHVIRQAIVRRPH